jgi:hypothetical protein
VSFFTHDDWDSGAVASKVGQQRLKTDQRIRRCTSAITVLVNIDANKFRILQFIVWIAAATEAADMKIQYNNFVVLAKPRDKRQ